MMAVETYASRAANGVATTPPTPTVRMPSNANGINGVNDKQRGNGTDGGL